MYLCIPKKPEIMNGLLYHSYNNYKLPIIIDDYNFSIKDFNNQEYFIYIIDAEIEITNENRNILFFILKDTRVILDEIHKITHNDEEFNTVKCMHYNIYENNKLLIAVYNNTLRIYDNKKRLFECPIKNNYPHGLATEYYESNKIKFFRIYKMGIVCGNGTEYSLNGEDKKKYVGYFENNQYHGQGQYFYDSGNLQYKGEFRNGSIYKGTEYYDYNGGVKYEGEFLNNKYNGQGIQYYNGIFCNANLKGKKKYEGTLMNGIYHGEGIKYNNVNGNIQYKGTFSNGKLNGQVLEYNEEGKLIYDGKYFNDYKHGEGSEYTNGKLSFKGQFVNGVYHGVGSRYSTGEFSLGAFTYANGKIQ